MSFRYIVLSIIIGLMVAMDVYILGKRLHRMFERTWLRLTVKVFLFVSSIVPWVSITYLFTLAPKYLVPTPRLSSFALGLVFTFFFTKLSLTGFLLLNDIIRFIFWVGRKIKWIFEGKSQLQIIDENTTSVKTIRSLSGAEASSINPSTHFDTAQCKPLRGRPSTVQDDRTSTMLDDRTSRVLDDRTSTKENERRSASRRDFIKKFGLAVAGLQFINYFHGMTRGRYNFTVRRITVDFPNLPPSFDGFRIVHFTDFHSGSFDDPNAVDEGFRLMESEKPDMILFTGDLVNTFADEVENYLPLFNRLNAPFGKFAVTGNHDYGHTQAWNSQSERDANFLKLMDNYRKTGFEMLLNRNVKIQKGNEHIRLAGIENWGKPPFPQHGDLNLALEGVEDNDFCILLSHDPTHWSEKTLRHPRFVDLTFSGHTHGAQMGVEIPGFRFSPAQWIYKHWAGLYNDQNEPESPDVPRDPKRKQHLYVNRGFGWLGFPGRAGIWPEIAVIELRRKS